MTELLAGKTAIIYGGGGGIGGGVARTFAREGASVFLVGRTREKLAEVAGEITSSGGSAEEVISPATSASFSRVRPTRNTLAPSRAKVRATPPPIPPPPP